MSAPAAKAFCDPVRRIADIEGDLSAEERAVLSSLMRGVERALRALGRLSVTGFLLEICLWVRLGEGSTLCYSWSRF